MLKGKRLYFCFTSVALKRLGLSFSLGSLSNSVFKRLTSTGSGHFASLGSDWLKLSGKQKTLSNTNLLASRHLKREKASLPVDVRRLKTALLKGAVSRQSSSFCLIIANYSPSIAMELKVSKEITGK